ncbi:trimeric intracellular cation channel family protein [Pararhizobium haloflavum]|uniref:trimeric intracellular cation channel family protein n=1 Tax=Pararhizobium haloflavum TaxID=2037914 RepID=UPI000C18453A|nr:trimeric intracellular cation channel family protein [Pararhizobium haloflavum]
MPILELMDYAGVAVFAATGALAASRKLLDIIGFLFLAGVTGIGGGTLRDVILGVPVFWVENPTYLIVCASVAVIVFLTAHLVESRYRLLIWLDAVGLSAYCVMGAAKGFDATGSMTVAVVMGMLTATFGGILRDLLSGEPSVLMRPEVYVTAALAGASTYTVTAAIGTPIIAASLAGLAVAFTVRGGALRYGWAFSPYRPRPGRPPDDVM